MTAAYIELPRTQGPCVLLESTSDPGPLSRLTPARATRRHPPHRPHPPVSTCQPNILIRSAVVHEGAVTFHAGGGIVADSDPDREYEETLHKAEAMRLALEATLQTGPRTHGDTEGTW